MALTINGKTEELAGETIFQLLIRKGISEEKHESVVVEYNYNIVKREKWNEILLNNGDNIEILKFLGGG